MAEKRKYLVNGVIVLFIISDEVNRIWAHALGQTVDVPWGTNVDADLAKCILGTVQTRLGTA